MKVSVSYPVASREMTCHTAMTMDCFGLEREAGEHVIAADLELPITAGQVVAFVGGSGTGKSSLMRAASAQLDGRVVWIDQLPLEEKPLVDELGVSAERAFELLTICGLGEARLMLRTPGELSDGQRARYRWAKGLAQEADWLVADEFTSPLDRTLAKVLAFGVVRGARRQGTGILLATVHDDVLEDVQADLLVCCREGGVVEVTAGDSQKKSASLLPGSWSLPRDRLGTSRRSLGGIIAATGWG